MITKTEQKWEIGETVKCGFLRVVVMDKIETPGDGRPDVYICTSTDGTKFYTFTPHFGLQSVTASEIIELRRKNAPRFTVAEFFGLNTDHRVDDREKMRVQTVCNERLIGRGRRQL